MVNKLIFLLACLCVIFCACSEEDDDITGPRENVYSAVESVTVNITGQTRTGFSLAGINGRAVISGGGGNTTISVKAVKRVKSYNWTDAERGLTLLTVAFDSSSADVGVRTIHPINPAGREYEVDYAVTIPEDLAVQISNVNGDVALQSILNDVAVQLTNGEVTAVGIEGDASIALTNGGIDASLTVPPGGQIDIELANGDVDLFIPTSTSAQFSAVVSVGSITVTGLSMTNVTQTATMLTGTLGIGNGQISLEVGNGSINVEGL